MNFNSKLFEQNRRDGEKEGSSHNRVSFTPSTSTQICWRSHTDCQQCKASLVLALGVSFLQTITQQLRPRQSLYIVGAFLITLVIMFICFQENEYNSDSNEEDIRISETQATRILIYSPDTDIYNIGVKFLTKMLFCSIMCTFPYLFLLAH